jgi:hypothetical protein
MADARRGDDLLVRQVVREGASVHAEDDDEAKVAASHPRVQNLQGAPAEL